MIPAKNKPYIDKCIVSFSHDRFPSRAQADATSLAKARREIEQGKLGVSHLILRACDDTIDRLKFLFLIHGIPIMCYALTNILRSSLQQIVVVGSRETEKILQLYLEINGDNGKTVRFVEEDTNNLSILNTLSLGKNSLDLDLDEMVLFQPGDLPFLYDMEKTLKDEDIENHNLILWLNSRQQMFPEIEKFPESEFVRRNYHYRGIYEDGKQCHDLKEPNIYPINLSRVEMDIIEYLHSSRKDGNIFEAGIRKAASLPTRLLRLIPNFIHHWKYFQRDLKKLRGNREYKFGAHEGNFHEGASILLNTPFKTKLHDDPAFVSDVDALEDWEDFEAMTHCITGSHGENGLQEIHPGGGDLLRFKEKAMPELKKILPIYADFPAYLNQIYKDMEMPHVPFDAKGNYVMPRARQKLAETACRWYQEKCKMLQTRC